MPEEICPDLARELLNKLAFLTVKDGNPVCAVRSLKAFRAVNVVCRDAFDDDKAGCKILARYMRMLILREKARIGAIDNLTKLHERERGHPGSPALSRDGWKALAWIGELRKSLQCDMGNHEVYLAALLYKIDGCVLADWEVYHRAMLPVTHAHSLQKPGGGLPCGPWHLTASRIRRAPHGTCAVNEALLMKVTRHKVARGMSHRAWAERTAARLLGISRADEDATLQQHLASVGQMLHHLVIADEPTE
jgi:hypothetical protein